MIGLPKTKRIKLNGIFIPVKVYYEREIDIPEEWKEDKKGKSEDKQISMTDNN